MKPALTQDRLKEFLHYDPETGAFTWLVSNSNRAPAGSVAGSTNANGYRAIAVCGRNYYAHRLAFLYMLGAFPNSEVDHINREKGDNRWENLRIASSRENKGNLGLLRNNTSGHRGVTWNKREGKWRAHGRHYGRTVYLGDFYDLENAAAASRAWREETFGAYAAV